MLLAGLTWPPPTPLLQPVLRSYLIGTTLNSILVGQIIFYWLQAKKSKKKA